MVKRLRRKIMFAYGAGACLPRRVWLSAYGAGSCLNAFTQPIMKHPFLLKKSFVDIGFKTSPTDNRKCSSPLHTSMVI
jgi:hypothetical protein